MFTELLIAISVFLFELARGAPVVVDLLSLDDALTIGRRDDGDSQPTPNYPVAHEDGSPTAADGTYLSTAAIIGIIAGVLFIFVTVTLMIFCGRKRRWPPSKKQEKDYLYTG
ncbi:hypothetical protein F4778DRAFT_783172 [Xylariomycetidae sp. FL2044]|nr:hypothetical protein F4778DRAFT_783172 [Xylariomycetidae sp. FL2044]